MLFRELRLVFTSPLVWLVAIAAVAVAIVAPHVAVPLALCVGMPFVIAETAADHASARALLQLGRGPLALTLARFVALCVAVDVVLAPIVIASWRRAPDDVGALATSAIGAGLLGVAVVGIGLFASSLTSSGASATLATLVITCGAWALDVARAPLSFATPTAALRVFDRGLIDAKDVVTLLAGGLGLTLAAAALLPRTTPVETRAMRAAAALVVTLLACGGASQLRASIDLTRAQRASFPAPWVQALSHVGDPVEVTIHARRDDPRVDALEQRVLLPLRRYAKVRTRFAEKTEDVFATWRVGPREATTQDGDVSPEQAVRTVLDLAGVALAR
jgi:ABC-2 type transport system permease protein